MDIIRDFIINYNVEIIFGLILCLLLLLILYLIAQLRISSITKKYNRLTEGVEAASLEDMLIQHLDEVKEVKGQLSDIKSYCEEINIRMKQSLQRIGFIRYNAFNDMGSDLSFSIALLDDELTGFIITSIYGREESNMYAKPIVKGKSTYNLSVEEIQALDRAKNQTIVAERRRKTS